MRTIQLLSFALAGAALLCGCDRQTQVNTQKIDVLTQKIFILEQAQAKQLAAIQSQLASLPALLDRTENSYFTKGQDKALFYHTNTLYLLLAIDKKIQTQLQQAATAREAANAQAYYYHTNENDTAYFCAAQIADALTAQEKKIEDNVNAEIKRVNDELAKQIKLAAPDKAEAAKRAEMEAKLAQIQRDLDEIKTRMGITNPPATQP